MMAWVGFEGGEEGEGNPGRSSLPSISRPFRFSLGAFNSRWFFFSIRGATFSAQDALEAAIRAFNLKRHFPPPTFLDLFLRLHAVQTNQPGNDLGAALEIPIRDRVHALDQLRQQWVQRVLGGHAELEGVEEGDEVLCGDEDLRVGWGRGDGRRVRGCGGRVRASVVVGRGRC